MNLLGFVTGSVVAVKAQTIAENGEVVVARIDDEVTLKRFSRLDERTVELRPESTNPKHRRIEVDLARTTFEICGIVVGGLIGDGCNDPDCDLLPA